MYANVEQVDNPDVRHSSRSATLPVGSKPGDDFDTVSTSGKEKKSSVLGRFLSRKNKWRFCTFYFYSLLYVNIFVPKNISNIHIFFSLELEIRKCIYIYSDWRKFGFNKDWIGYFHVSLVSLLTSSCNNAECISCALLENVKKIFLPYLCKAGGTISFFIFSVSSNTSFLRLIHVKIWQRSTGLLRKLLFVKATQAFL